MSHSFFDTGSNTALEKDQGETQPEVNFDALFRYRDAAREVIAFQAHIIAVPTGRQPEFLVQLARNGIDASFRLIDAKIMPLANSHDTSSVWDPD
jgi:hypothetical protein